jgi:uncharacterized protein
MIPVRFGADAREMVGFYHPPAQPGPGKPAVLICNPFGQEAIRSYRMLRLLADRLAAAGCSVLRFDYFGTGDSPGEDDAASLAGWAGDIGSAHRELVARSPKPSVTWVGVRLGASLCALAAQTARAQLQRIVMWDPIIDGPAYLASFGGSTPEANVEAMGFALSERFKNELRSLNLARLHPLKITRASLILGQDNALAQQWRGSLEAAGMAFDWTVSAAAAAWNSDKAMNTASIPAELLKLVQSKVLEPVA